MEQNAVGSWRTGEGLQVPSSPWLNARDLQLESARVLHETLLVLVLKYRVRQCYGKRRRDIDFGCTDGRPQRIARY